MESESGPDGSSSGSAAPPPNVPPNVVAPLKMNIDWVVDVWDTRSGDWVLGGASLYASNGIDMPVLQVHYAPYTLY
jgi:hypothetical protein